MVKYENWLDITIALRLFNMVRPLIISLSYINNNKLGYFMKTSEDPA